MLLTEKYDAAIVRGDIYNDPLQREVLNILQGIADELNKPRRFWFRRKMGIKGLYLYGRVGAGKTFLMDLFYHAITNHQKVRVHFHEFMQQIDAQLRHLQGHPDPLKSIAAKIARITRVLCLDEFLVQDVATAMVLAELLKHLYAHGMVLILTSNTAPDDLYLNGLQRVRFIPAIALLKQHCDVVSLTEPRDYRLGHKPLMNAYLYPLNEETKMCMQQQFLSILNEDEIGFDALIVQGRTISTIQHGDRVVWFNFDVICNLPRSQLDYLEIANRFNTVFVSDVPVLGSQDTVRALLLMHFIDVMYDRRVKVIISAEVPIDSLYVDGELHKAFQRTRSRLQEMQSEGYLV